MKLEIPFHSSWATPGHPLGVNCLETSLKMLLGYFEPGKEYSIEELEKITTKQPEKGSWTMSFSIWFANHGYKVKHYSTFNFEKFKTEGINYIRDAYGDDIAEWQLANTDLSEAQGKIDDYLKKVELVEKKPTVADVKVEMRTGYIIRAAVDSGLLNDTPKYEGHSVVVIGYDNDSIWFHDPGLPAQESRKVSNELFQKAMDAFGGEMDAIKKVH